MYCQKCGTEIPEDAAFCLKCGNKLESDPTPRISNKALWLAGLAAAMTLGIAIISFWQDSKTPKAESDPSDIAVSVSPSPSPTPTPLPIIKVLKPEKSLPAVIAPKASPEPTQTPSPSPQTTPPIVRKTKYTFRESEPQQQSDIQPARPRSQVIVRDSFTINAGNYIAYPIYPNTAGLPIRVTGQFEAQGGQNDIECFILDEVGFMNFKNRQRVGTYYNSGRATVGNVHAVLHPRGQNYYVVFSNVFSTFTPKAVRASVVGLYLGQ